MAQEGKKIGVCLNESTPREVAFMSPGNVSLGDYVELEYENARVLGFVKSLSCSNRLFDNDFDFRDLNRLKKISRDHKVLYGKIVILGDVNKNMFIPRIPPPPGTDVYLASSSTLKKVFGESDEKKICIGSLLTRDDVDVYVDIDQIVSRHLAILAITGAGKSNTVSVIIEGMLEKLGSILVFDMHGEYVNFDYKIGGESVVKRLDLKLNPVHLSYREFRQFANVDDNSFIQDRYLKRAFKKVIDEISTGVVQVDAFWGRLLGELERYKELASEKDSDIREDRKSIIGVINKVEDMKESYSGLFDLLQKPIVEQIEPARLNVIDFSHVDEKIADVIVSHVLRNMLEERKKYVHGYGEGLEFPVFSILEEAHILASSSTRTRSKYWISRIAREGRKFGLGLCLVSQRPKALDVDALSQANNMIILKLVEPGDQRHVQQASEALSSELVEQLSSLNVGEALVMGKMIPVPALVKIRRARGKRAGNDTSAVEEWAKVAKEKKNLLEEIESFYTDEEEF
ncbi:helicase HerA domain-containing protein [Desulfurobacterium sp.]